MFRSFLSRKNRHLSVARKQAPRPWFQRLGTEFLEERDVPATFAPGDLVVERLGDGSAALSGNACAIFLDEYKPDGTLVQSVAMPTSTSGSQLALVETGSATSAGFMSRSTDGKYLAMPGYNSSVGATNPATTAGIDRVIGRVDTSGNVDTSTKFTQTDGYNGNNFRSIASIDGSVFWTGGTGSGTSGGIRTIAFGSTASGNITPVSTTVTNIRVVQIFAGQLYASDASGSAVRLGTVGTGTPTDSGNTLTNLPGFLTASGSPYGFFFADLSASVTGVDTLYVADDGGQIQKWTLPSDGANWTASGTIAASTVRGLTGVQNGSVVTLYGTSGSAIYSLTDSSGFNANITGTLKTIASAATNTAVRGITFVPETLAVGGTLNDGTQGSNYSQSVTITINGVDGVGTAAAPVFAITSGSLPHNLSLNASTGVISGTPDQTGTSNFTVTVRDSTGLSANKSFSITINSGSSNTATSTNVTADNSTVTYGTTVTFTATIHATSGSTAPSKGSVEFFDNGSDIGAGSFQSSSGTDSVWTFQTTSRQLQVTGSAHTIKAAYTAGSGFADSNGTMSETVNTKALTVTGITADDKVYDGGQVAVIHTGSAALQGKVSGDTVTLDVSSAAGTFASKDVGSGITVAISGLSLAGADAGNYSLTQPSTTASITKKSLTVTGITADDKVYDGGKVAVIHTGSRGAFGEGEWRHGNLGRIECDRHVCVEGRGERHHGGDQRPLDRGRRCRRLLADAAINDGEHHEEGPHRDGDHGG